MVDVTVMVTKEATLIRLKAGDDDWEPSEVLYDLLEYAQDAGNVPPAYKEFAKQLRSLMDAAILANE